MGGAIGEAVGLAEWDLLGRVVCEGLTIRDIAVVTLRQLSSDTEIVEGKCRTGSCDLST